MQMQKRRIYDIFDRSANGWLSWTDFYDSISLCYFADAPIMAMLMFMIFDQFLEKELDRHQLTLLVDLNAVYLHEGSLNGSEFNI